MKQAFTGYRRRDWVIAAVLALFMFALFGVQLTPGMENWGDDFAAYMSEGIAISQGRFHELIAQNGKMYMAEVPEQVMQEGLVYVWGFPLLLSLVHSLVGFDMIGYSTVIWYKLPSLLAFCCFVGILYLFYRRFLPAALSVFLTLLLAMNHNLLYSIDILNVDIVFLFAAMLSFLLAECFWDTAEKDLSRSAPMLPAIFLGIALWFTYETRLNGSTVLLVIALGHGIRLVQWRKSLRFKVLLGHLCPYLVFLVLKIATEAILAPATSNTSHVGTVTPEILLSNLEYYRSLTTEFLRELANYTRFYNILRWCLVLGLLSRAFRWRNLPFTLLLFGTYLVLILLPYTQGLRYLYGALPFLLLYIGHGCWDLAQLCLRLLDLRKAPRKLLSVAASAAVLILLCNLSQPRLRAGIRAFREGTSLGETDVYSPEAVDMYRFIQNNLPEDAVIVFIKTRALSLNTGRLSIFPGFHGQVMTDADYYLYSEDVHSDLDIWIKQEQEAIAPPVYENGIFYLYEIQK